MDSTPRCWPAIAVPFGCLASRACIGSGNVNVAGSWNAFSVVQVIVVNQGAGVVYSSGAPAAVSSTPAAASCRDSSPCSVIR